MGLLDYGGGSVTSPGQPTGGDDAPGGGGFNWKAMLPMLLGGAGSALLGGKAGLGGFATGFANESHRRQRETEEKNYRVESALADQAHKEWQDLANLDLSNVPPEMSGVKERLDALSQKRIQSLSADSPGGARQTAKESQELIALAATLRASVPQINRANEEAQFTRHEELKQQAADAPHITGRENMMLAEAGVNRSDLGAMSLPPEELRRLAGEGFSADRAAAQQRQFTGMQSPEAVQQDIGKAVDTAERLKSIPPPLVSLGEQAGKFYGLGGAGQYGAGDIEAMQQKRREEASIRAAAAGRAHVGGLANDPQTQAAVQDLAGRVKRGELTWQQAMSSLGGVKGGMGPAFTMAMSGGANVPPKQRQQLSSIEQARTVVSQIREMAAEIQTASDPVQRAEKSLLLKNYVASRTGILARGFSGESGVLTQGDIERAGSIIPGWQAANFNPDFLEDKLSTIDQGFSLQEQAILKGYFQEVGSGPGGLRMNTPPVTGAQPASSTGNSRLDAFRKKHGIGQ